MSINPQKLAASIKYWRSQRGLTQRQLADLMAVDKQTVYNWERGQCLERHIAAFKLLFALRYDCNLSDLILVTTYSNSDVLNLVSEDQNILEVYPTDRNTIEEARRAINSDKKVSKLNQDGVAE
jgi:transcriptional regulator with XRE-family HTH domain